MNDVAKGMMALLQSKVKPAAALAAEEEKNPDSGSDTGIKPDMYSESALDYNQSVPLNNLMSFNENAIIGV